MSTRTAISRDEYLQIVGLLTLAQEHRRALDEIQEAVAAIVKEPPDDAGGQPYYGHVSDAVYSGYSARELLQKMEIKVVAPKKSPRGKRK